MSKRNMHNSYFPADRPISLGALSEAVNEKVQLAGDSLRLVKGVAALENLEAGYLGFSSAQADKADAAIESAKEGCIIVCAPSSAISHLAQSRSLVFCSRPRLWFIKAVRILFGTNQETTLTDISEKAFVDKTSEVGAGSKIDPFVTVGSHVVIGRQGCLHSGVHLKTGVILGSNVTVQNNTVIGSTGLACERSTVYDPFIDLPHLASVQISDHVRIGANCTITRGTLKDTFIGAGTVIGNQVTIGHNVRIGTNCFISSGVTIAGSATIGDGSWIGPGVVILNKVRLGQRVKVAVGSVVNRDSADEVFLAGHPARPVAEKK